MKKLSLTLTVVTFIFLLQSVLTAQPNLVTNGDFNNGNTGFTSLYAYCNTAGCMGACGCPPQYSVGNDATFYHGLLTGSDHTTGTGNFLIADGGVSAVTVWKQTVAVDANTDYSFSFWLSSVYISPPASIQVKINGVNIASPFTAPASLNTWIQCNASWNSGANTSAIIDLTDLSTVFVGNDFGLDDISLKRSCNSSNPFICIVNPDLNSINVVKSSDISVTFLQDMNASTINSSNIKVFGQQTGLISSSVSYNSGTRTATINPNTDFKVGEKIQITLTSGIQNSSNSPITQFTWTFTVQALGGTGIFTECSIIDSVSIVNVQHGVSTKSADIDNDGDLDLITDGYFNGVHIYKNIGFGNFTETQVITGLPNVEHYQGLCLGDFNSDGDVDIALAVATNTPGVANLITFSNDGSGNFSQSAISVGGGLIGATGDLDGDGDLDIVMSWALDAVRYCINDGNGNFTNYTISNLGYFHSNGCDLGDIDNDGDNDIMISIQSFPLTKQIYLLNDGSANFTYCSDYTTTSYFDDQKLADINGDRKLDLVGRNYIYKNNGSCTFTQNIFSAGAIAMPFDFEGDGDIDLAYSNYPSNDVLCYTNDGSGNFANLSNTILGGETVAGATGDFDNDGDIDFTVNNLTGHGTNRSDISIVMNNYTPPCVITGPGNIPIYSVHTYYSSIPGGFWALINYDNTSASISGSHINDSLVVNAGSVGGHFVLYYHNNTGVLCHLHVYVDDPLPVELSSFTSNVVNSDVILNWITASEFNNSGFDIERKSVNENWSKVGFVEGNGNISTQVNYTFTDKNLSSGNYNYRLKQIDFNGNFEYYELNGEVTVGVPAEFRLSQNYPNPFNPSTKINYELPNAGKVSLKVYDIVGKEVITLVNESQNAGRYSVVFNAANLPSGIYYYKITAGSFIEVRKMILIK